MRGHGLRIDAAVALGLLLATPVAALDAPATLGRAFAREHCASCHAVGPRGASPMREAPSFRSLARRFPINDTADVMVEGTDHRHAAMPDFRLDRADTADLTAYLKALRR